MPKPKKDQVGPHGGSKNSRYKSWILLIHPLLIAASNISIQTDRDTNPQIHTHTHFRSFRAKLGSLDDHVRKTHERNERKKRNQPMKRLVEAANEYVAEKKTKTEAAVEYIAQKTAELSGATSSGTKRKALPQPIPMTHGKTNSQPEEAEQVETNKPKRTPLPTHVRLTFV